VDPDDLFDEWNNSLLARFPPITTLSLFGFSLSYISYTSLPSIHELRLNYIEMELVTILTSTYLPNLTFLDIDPLGQPKSVPHSFVLPNLHTLKTWSGNKWIRQMTCPNITTFIVDVIRSDTHPCGVLRWISIHPTITRVECNYVTHYELLANSCPHLEHLVIRKLDRCFHPDHIRMPRFPALKTLGFYDHDHDTIGCPTLEIFEQLVRSRCLPASHEKSQLAIGERELESLYIIFLSKKKPTQKDIGGTLYQEAKKTSTMLDAKEMRHLGFRYVGYEGLKWSLS
jgi:hypothetical protein